MDVILTSVRWQFALADLNDIFVFSKSPQDHTKQVWRVLRLACKAGVTPKLKKRKFFAETIDYLGHIIWPGRLELAEHITDDVAKLEHPSILTELCSFLSLCNIIRRFVPSLAHLAAPINRKLRKDQAKYFVPLDEKKSTSDSRLKGELVRTPVLTLLKSKDQYTLDTDTCDK